jgi:hypothetical protein
MNNNVNAELRKTIHALFENSSPILVEVRFPNMGASPDWHLCEDQEQFDQLLERLAPGVEVRASSVWDLRNVKGEVTARK